MSIANQAAREDRKQVPPMNGIRQYRPLYELCLAQHFRIPPPHHRSYPVYRREEEEEWELTPHAGRVPWAMAEAAKALTAMIMQDFILN